MANEIDFSALIDGEKVSKLDTKACVKEVHIGQLWENKENKIFPTTEDDMDALKESILLNGLLEPPVVTPALGMEGCYQIVSGHRRVACVRAIWKETKDQRWERITCVVRDFPEPEFATLALIQANTKVRTNKKDWIAPAAKAEMEALDALRKKGYKVKGRTRELIAKQLGISSSELQRQMFIDRHLHSAVRDRWPDLPTDTANAIAKMSEVHQIHLAMNRPKNLDRPISLDISVYKKAAVAGEDPLGEAKKQSEQKKERERREKEAVAAERKEAAERRRKEGNKIRCGYSGTWKYRSECQRGGDCEKECCFFCDERYFCEKACQHYRSNDDNANGRGVAHRVRAARIAAGLEVPEPAEMWGSLSVADLRRLPGRLKCTADYLLGLTTELRPAPPPIPPLPNASEPAEWKILSEKCQPNLFDEVVLIWYDDGFGWVSSVWLWLDETINQFDYANNCVMWSMLPDLEKRVEVAP